jgi:hypothetical protein
MKCGARFVGLCLLAGWVAWAQAGQKSDPSAPQGRDQQQEDERPTLGPRNAPGIVSGPDTSTTTDIRKLMRIHTLYIESIDNSLSEKLIEAIGKWGRFRLVTKPKDADATLRGSCLESRRLKHVHSEVFISDRNGASIWQDTIIRPFNPPALDQAVTDTATLVEAHLQQAIQEGDQR